MTNQDILDLGLTSGLIDKRHNGQLIIDFTLLPDPDLYKFARLIEETAIAEAVERVRNLSYVSSSGD